jgi:hypothetical protein
MLLRRLKWPETYKNIGLGNEQCINRSGRKMERVGSIYGGKYQLKYTVEARLEIEAWNWIEFSWFRTIHRWDCKLSVLNNWASLDQLETGRGRHHTRRLKTVECERDWLRCAELWCAAQCLNYLSRPSNHLYIWPLSQPSKWMSWNPCARKCKRFFGTVSARKAVKLATLTKQHSRDTDLCVSPIQLRYTVPPTRTLRI